MDSNGVMDNWCTMGGIRSGRDRLLIGRRWMIVVVVIAGWGLCGGRGSVWGREELSDEMAIIGDNRSGRCEPLHGIAEYCVMLVELSVQVCEESDDMLLMCRVGILQCGVVVGGVKRASIVVSL